MSVEEDLEGVFLFQWDKDGREMAATVVVFPPPQRGGMWMLRQLNGGESFP